MNLIYLTSNYPSPGRPGRGAFVRNFVRACVRQGADCSVVNPVSHFERRFGPLGPRHATEEAGGRSYQVYRPRFISASTFKLFSLNTGVLSQNAFKSAAAGVIGKLDQKFDLIYGHFMYPSGAIAAALGKRFGLPSFAAFGDDSLAEFSEDSVKEDFHEITGIICVSSRNLRYCKEVLGTPDEKLCLFPNGVDLELFKPLDKVAMRKKHGLPLDRTIIAFTGHFDERKGPHRLLKAAEGLDVGLLFIGRGSVQLEDERILFKGQLPHDQVPEFLSAADIFALPTLSDGSCNAIIEALACGLPVVSSDGEFNDDILNNDVSLRVDTANVSQIREALVKLIADAFLRRDMSEAARKHAMSFDVNLRAKGILAWMANRIEINASVAVKTPR